jgi:cardiolipin synthase
MRRTRHLLCTLAFTSMVGACASMPDVTPVAVNGASATPSVASVNGMLSSKQASALLEKRWRSATPDMAALASLEEAVTGVPLIAGNKVTLLFDGPQIMAEMMAAANAATDTINLETYIFDQDEIGLKFADLLIEKQKKGVAVNIMYDSVGTIGTPKAFFQRMADAGIRLIEFNPIAPGSKSGKWEINNRDHRKVMIVDGKIAFTGGVNISADYAASSLFRKRSRPAANAAVGWRDTHIKVEGPAVAAFQWMFVNSWVKQEAGELPERNYFPPQKAVGTKLMRVLATEPDAGFQIYRSFVLAIQQAKKSIHMTAAYFVPDQQIVDALTTAARNGVDVTLVLPGVSDHGLVLDASRSFYDELLAGGVKIHEMQVNVLHAKAAVIDGNWSTIGSSNIDRRSFLHNYELNVVVLDEPFAVEMENAFREDIRNSKQITQASWGSRSVVDRFKQWFARRWAYWL